MLRPDYKFDQTVIKQQKRYLGQTMEKLIKARP